MPRCYPSAPGADPGDEVLGDPGVVASGAELGGEDVVVAGEDFSVTVTPRPSAGENRSTSPRSAA